MAADLIFVLSSLVVFSSFMVFLPKNVFAMLFFSIFERQMKSLIQEVIIVIIQVCMETYVLNFVLPHFCFLHTSNDSDWFCDQFFDLFFTNSMFYYSKIFWIFYDQFSVLRLCFSSLTVFFNSLFPGF